MWLERRDKNARSLGNKVEKLEKFDFFFFFFVCIETLSEIRWSSYVFQERFWICSVCLNC